MSELKLNAVLTIVHIEDFFHPEAGYQINIMPKYLQKFGHKNVIITSEIDKIPQELTAFFGRDNINQKDEFFYRQTGIKIIRLPLKKFASGRAIFYDSQLFSTINDLTPDVLYIHGNDTFTAMQIIKNRNKFNCKLVFDSHMLSMASKNKLSKLFHWYYAKFVTPKIIKNGYVVIRTQNDDYVYRELKIPLSQAPWISYGSDTMLFHPDEHIKQNFKVKNEIPDNAFVVVYAGKLDESKGGQFLAETIREKFDTKREIVFVIVGNATGEYGEIVEEIFAMSENRIIRYPTQKYSELARYFQVADLVVFPKQCSLSFYDVEACGVPVLSEDNNINVDRCSHENGWNFKSGSIDDFREKIEYIVGLSSDELKRVGSNAYNFIIKNYNYENKAREYEKVIMESYGRKKN